MCIRDSIHTYMHTYIHTYIHAYIHAYIHTCIHTYIRTYIHTYMHTYIHNVDIGRVRETRSHVVYIGLYVCINHDTLCQGCQTFFNGGAVAVLSRKWRARGSKAPEQN